VWKCSFERGTWEYLAGEIREEVGLVTLRLKGGIGGKKEGKGGHVFEWKVGEGIGE